MDLNSQITTKELDQSVRFIDKDDERWMEIWIFKNIISASLLWDMFTSVRSMKCKEVPYGFAL